jgi:hypothetical protein
MMEFEKRKPPWYLVASLILGIGLGLLTAWYWYPVELIDTHPATMREDFKDNYREMIAAAFVMNGDLGRAKTRLALLQDENPIRAISSQAQITLAEGGSEESARALGLLAAALSVDLTPTAVTDATGTPTPAEGTEEVTGTVTNDSGTETTGTPGLTITPVATNTPKPTSTPTATQGSPFTVDLFSEICDPELPGALIRVFVFDAARRPVPGVEVFVTWEGGRDVFYTGLKPEIDLGYADFAMAADVLYAVGLTLGDQPVTGIATRECQTEDGEQTFSSWEIIYVQP